MSTRFGNHADAQPRRVNQAVCMHLAVAQNVIGQQLGRRDLCYCSVSILLGARNVDVMRMEAAVRKLAMLVVLAQAMRRSSLFSKGEVVDATNDLLQYSG